MFIDPLGLANIVIVAGGDRASNNNAFKDNANTWIKENITSEDTVILIDVGNNTYSTVTSNSRVENDKTYSSANNVMDAVKDAFGSDGIDKLIFECHSGSSSLVLRYDISLSESKFRDYFKDRWVFHDKQVKLNDDAIIKFTGCETGKGDNSFAQKAANVTGKTVWGATTTTSQVMLQGGGKTYQMTETAITTGISNGTIYQKDGAFYTYSKPTNTGHIKYTKK